MTNATVKLRGVKQVYDAEVNNEEKKVGINEKQYNIQNLSFDVPVSGTVYGTLLNYKGAFDAFSKSMHEDPYKAPPKAPVLYIKPENTFSSHQAPVPLPAGVPELEIGAALGVVIGKNAKQIKEADVLDYIKGYTIVNDVSIPHESVHRPAVKEKARDGFCPIGPWITDRDKIENPDNLNIRVSINGEVKQENNTKNLIRSVGKLIEDITEFMTLQAGDTLLVGVPENAPLAQKNDRVTIEIEGIGVLENTIKNEDQVIGGDTV